MIKNNKDWIEDILNRCKKDKSQHKNKFSNPVTYIKHKDKLGNVTIKILSLED